MANKRMIAKMIVDSDAFLSMPVSTQNLYFHLNVRADDEGFIDKPLSVMRIVNASEDDMRVLMSKRYLLKFDSGVIVIKHWKLHNTIRKDRLIPTIYQEERDQIFEKENGSYTDMKPLEIECQPDVNQMSTNCPHRLDQISIDKDSIVKPKRQRFEVPTVNEIKEYLSTRGILTFTAEAFHDYYQSKGWMIGKNKMKDWKAAVRTWQAKDPKKSTGGYAPNITDNGLRFDA